MDPTNAATALRLGLASLVLLACAPPFDDPGGAESGRPRDARGWTHYGGDAGGQRHSDLEQIGPDNVADLEVAWTYHTGDVAPRRGEGGESTAFENTPIVVDGRLVFCTPFNRVIALDPSNGAELWVHDPGIDRDLDYANQYICRGVEAWRDPGREPDQPCSTRIFSATNDGRLIALDVASGERCADFGADGSGEVDLNPAAGEQLWRGEYQVTSPPVVAGGAVVVGSAVGDNQRWNAPSGVVRAFDARSGAQLWAFDLSPPGFVHTPENSSAAGHALGTPNVWAQFSVDEERGLVFAPTGNPMLDYYRGQNPEMSHYGSSVVALHAATGEIAWSFQTVHHDLWDFDVPAQPTLTEVFRDGEPVPVVVQPTKMGFTFVLHRETGEPVFPVEERPVPQDGAPGEQLSPTQPFPVKPDPLVRTSLGPDDAWGVMGWDWWWCRNRIAELRYDGIFTPPTTQGSLMLPGNAGGSNWGGVAVDPDRQVMVANTMDLPWFVQLIPREEVDRSERRSGELSPQVGTPFVLWRDALLSPLGLPCVDPPWGTLAVIDLDTGDILWQRAIGTIADLVPLLDPHWELGTPNLGGPLVTASGLIFLGATMDDYLRAIDLVSGEELWRGRLPAGGQATPMTYEAEGVQYVVIAAGGHGRAGTRLGDALVAFRLPATE
ncbi:MAG: pyrroloquinoline quinone-dependent dehydrogenase [Myxococcota bacterium]